MKKIVKYSENRKYRDFIEEEFQEKNFFNKTNKQKIKNSIKKKIDKFLSFFKL